MSNEITCKNSILYHLVLIAHFYIMLLCARVPYCAGEPVLVGEMGLTTFRSQPLTRRSTRSRSNLLHPSQPLNLLCALSAISCILQ
jgi:hypothetical protein